MRNCVKVFVLLLIVSLCSLTVFAGELERLQRDYNNSQAQARVKANELERSRDVANSISEKINYAQQEYEKAQDDYEKINDAIKSANDAIAETDDNIAKIQDKLAVRTKVLNKRVRDIFENGQISYLDVLLGARNFEDFVNRFELVKKLLTNDAKLVLGVNKERQELANQKLARLTDLERLKQLQQDAGRTRDEVAARKKEQDAIMAVAESDLYYREQAYEEEMAASRNIEQMIRNIGQGGSNQARSTGAMIWPASGPITSPFGWRVHPIYGTSIFHSGIDIGADYGTTIAAADGGTVIYADWMSGYGKTIIIQHANGLSSLYGHCSAILVSRGQQVSKGQAIGRVGSTGNSTGPHLHFEVRSNGSPVNPGNYLG